MNALDRLCHMPPVTPFEKKRRAAHWNPSVLTSSHVSKINGKTYGIREKNIKTEPKPCGVKLAAKRQAKEKIGVISLLTLSKSLYFDKGENAGYQAVGVNSVRDSNGFYRPTKCR